MTNCPNCGAPIISSQCEYCGTTFGRSSEYCSSDVLSLLKLKTEHLKRTTELNMLYEDALFAMRAYGSGILTYNEAREKIGLKRR